MCSGAMYAFAMASPQSRKLAITSLAARSPNFPAEIGRVEFLGSRDPLPITRDETATTISLSEEAPNPLRKRVQDHPKGLAGATGVFTQLLAMALRPYDVRGGGQRRGEWSMRTEGDLKSRTTAEGENGGNRLRVPQAG
jgi:hypothetical protein